MDNQDYRHNITVQYCLPDNNKSCIKHAVYGTGYILMCFILSCISVCTVILNLLVIISISHFKQLHTPTNLIILSLAVADLLVGLFNMPMILSAQMDACWYLGPVACYISVTIGLVSKYGSLHSMILIAVDRYIAITNPLQYSSHITLHKTLLSIIFGWCCWLCYVIVQLYFNELYTDPNAYSQCYGECVVYEYKYWTFIELVAAFLAPCSLIIILYSVIFKVAIHQAKAIKAVKDGATNNNGAKTPKSSEVKAAKKLGTVVFLYLVCWIPNYLIPAAVYTPASVWGFLIWLTDLNSFMNPLIYVISYSWFRTSAKYILTRRIFESSSSRLDLFPEH